MEAMIERCAGLDVHQEEVVGCVLFGPLDKRPKKSIESFPTTTDYSHPIEPVVPSF